MKFRFPFLILTATVLFLSSCSNDDNPTQEVIDSGYTEGILVSHEGSFGKTSGSVSFVSADLGIIQNDIYKVVNNEQLGDIQQSMGFHANEAYIVVDRAHEVTVVDQVTFENKTTIDEGLATPRFIAFDEQQGYVTNWGDPFATDDDFIAVIDLNTDQVVATIPVAEGPEQILVKNNTLYVTHKGGYGNNNILSIIDTATAVVSELVLLDKPDDLLLDGFGNLWVLCHGNTIYGNTAAENIVEPGAIFKVDTATNTISKSFNFTGTDQPGFMGIDNGTLYYSLGKTIYEIDPATETFPGKVVTTVAATTFYGMALKNGQIYTLDAVDFASNGILKIYDIPTKNWSAPLGLGVVPSKVYFN